MSTPPEPPITRVELEAARQRLRELAADIARTEEGVAATFDRLAEVSGDPDGHRRRIAAEARRVAAIERARAGEDDTQTAE